jgi:hypothetical protein
VKERRTGDPNLLSQWLSDLAPGLPVCGALPSYLVFDYTDYASGFIPMIGYHHVLMIIIAVAIILLCEFSVCHMSCGMSLTCPSLTTCRMFIIITTNTGYLSDIFIL